MDSVVVVGPVDMWINVCITAFSPQIYFGLLILPLYLVYVEEKFKVFYPPPAVDKPGMVYPQIPQVYPPLIYLGSTEKHTPTGGGMLYF
jgi:hypothetical protein